MKRIVLFVVLVLAAVVPAVASGVEIGWDPFEDVPGEQLTEAGMQAASGQLRIFGVRILPRLFKVDRKQKTSAPEKVHCDVIAQNRADTIGLNTNNQDGSFSDYNQVKVGQIYEEFPDNRTSQPPAGSAGYVFSDYGSGMQHLESYSNRGGGDSYTRYWNDSFNEYTSTRSTSYVPPGVIDQVFVPLPEYGYADRYYR